MSDQPPELSERGFAHWPAITGDRDEIVKVYESSDASEPHLWVSIEGDAFLTGPLVGLVGVPWGRAPAEVAAHLTLDQARAVRDTLAAAIARSQRDLADESLNVALAAEEPPAKWQLREVGEDAVRRMPWWRRPGKRQLVELAVRALPFDWAELRRLWFGRTDAGQAILVLTDWHVMLLDRRRSSTLALFAVDMVARGMPDGNLVIAGASRFDSEIDVVLRDAQTARDAAEAIRAEAAAASKWGPRRRGHA
jgi:hypothetical protein